MSTLEAVNSCYFFLWTAVLDDNVFLEGTSVWVGGVLRLYSHEIYV